MNIAQLLSGLPQIKDKLTALGLSDVQINGLADAIGKQLNGEDGFDFTDLLTGLNAGDFLSQLNVPQLADETLLSPDTVEKATQTIAPAIEEFGGSAGGVLGKIASSLFSK